MRMIRAARAYTLVEILVVLIIIGILAGLVMLSSGGAIDTSQRAVCAADRRTIKSAYYAEDAQNRGKFAENIQNAMKQMDKNYEDAESISSNEAKYGGICPAGGSYDIKLDDDGKFTVTCNHTGHGGASESSAITSIPEIMQGVGDIKADYDSTKNKEFIKKLEETYGGKFPGTWPDNTALRNYVLAQLGGEWPKADGALAAALQEILGGRTYYVQPYYLGNGSVIYWAGNEATGHSQWKANAIMYNGKWYINNTGSPAGMSNLYNHTTVADAFKDNSLNFLNADGTIKDGWVAVK